MPSTQLSSLIARHQSDVAKLAKRLHSGAIDAQEFGDGLDAIVHRGHSRAIALGRSHAGDKSKPGEDDALLALDISDREATWLNKFVADLEDGRYTNDDGSYNLGAIERRGNMYAVKLRGTANAAFADASKADEKWRWELGPTEHCSDCENLAFASPLTRDELYTVPGNCDTDCLLGCACTLVRLSDGKEGF